MSTLSRESFVGLWTGRGGSLDGFHLHPHAVGVESHRHAHWNRNKVINEQKITIIIISISKTWKGEYWIWIKKNLWILGFYRFKKTVIGKDPIRDASKGKLPEILSELKQWQNILFELYSIVEIKSNNTRTFSSLIQLKGLTHWIILLDPLV